MGCVLPCTPRPALGPTPAIPPMAKAWPRPNPGNTPRQPLAPGSVVQHIAAVPNVQGPVLMIKAPPPPLLAPFKAPPPFKAPNPPGYKAPPLAFKVNRPAVPPPLGVAPLLPKVPPAPTLRKAMPPLPAQYD